MDPFTELFDWLWQDMQGLLVLTLIVVGFIWLAFTVSEFAVRLNSFDNRLTARESLCNDINNRQLPEVHAELKEINVRLSKA